MTHLRTRMTSTMLVFGIFFTLSCSTLSLSNEPAETLYERGQFSKALSSVNKSIEENPDDLEKKVLKAQILREVALERQNPTDRKNYYQNLRDVTDELSFTTKDYQGKTDSILVKAWSHEQGEGVRYLQEDDTDTYEIHFDKIISHFDNASVIIPDSLITYSLKSTTFYRHGETQNAISTLERAQDIGVELTPQIREKVAYLYLESGNLSKSIEIYEDLVAQHPEEQEYRHGLINALILNENHDESIKLLMSLSDEYPERREYIEALATERYFKISREIEDIILTDTGEYLATEDVEAIKEELAEIGELFQNIETERPARETHQYRVASFYTDSGNKLLSLSKNAEDQLAQLIVTKAEGFLELSLPYWRYLTETFPENRDYSQKLYNTYKLLGMNDDAELLEQQINF